MTVSYSDLWGELWGQGMLCHERTGVWELEVKAIPWASRLVWDVQVNGSQSDDGADHHQLLVAWEAGQRALYRWPLPCLLHCGDNGTARSSSHMAHWQREHASFSSCSQPTYTWDNSACVNGSRQYQHLTSVRPTAPCRPSKRSRKRCFLAKESTPFLFSTRRFDPLGWESPTILGVGRRWNCQVRKKAFTSCEQYENGSFVENSEELDFICCLMLVKWLGRF